MSGLLSVLLLKRILGVLPVTSGETSAGGDEHLGNHTDLSGDETEFGEPAWTPIVLPVAERVVGANDQVCGQNKSNDATKDVDGKVVEGLSGSLPRTVKWSLEDTLD